MVHCGNCQHKAAVPEHIARLPILGEYSLHLLPLCLNGVVDGFQVGVFLILEGEQEGVQKDSVAHQLRVASWPEITESSCRCAMHAVLSSHAAML